nr:hypothetical protein [Candidatus Gracilibacteria bacterium]
MSSVEFGGDNNIENQINQPVQKTGNSESNNYQNQSNTLKDIKKREIIDNGLDKSSVIKEEREKVIDYILKNYEDTDYQKIISQIIEGEATTLEEINIILSKYTDKEEVSQDVKEVSQDVKEVNQDVKEVNQDVKEVNQDVKEVNDNKNIYINLLKQQLSGLKSEKSKEVLGLLDNNPEKALQELKNQVTFNSIATELKQKDPQKFEEFAKTLLAIDKKTFTPIIDKFRLETLDNTAKLKLGTDNLSGVDLSKNTLTKKTDDGFTIEAGKSDRKLFLTGSEYKLDGKLNNYEIEKQFKEINKKTEEELKPLNEIISSVQKILDYLEKAILNKVDIKEVKETIKKSNLSLYNELNLENITSLEQIKQILTGFLKKSEEEKEEKIKEAKKKISELIMLNSRKAKEKDIKTRQTLSFLHEIGFDLLPQSATDYVINQINSNPNMMGLFTSPIDLKNGELGNTTLGGGLSVESKVKFTDFLSKILGLEGNDSLNYYKIQKGYFGAKVEGFGVGISGLKNYINNTYGADGIITGPELWSKLVSKN